MSKRKPITESDMRSLAEKTGLTFDGGDGETLLHHDREENTTVYANLMSKEQYKKMEEEINSLLIKGAGFEVYAWNDCSGYKYWNAGGETGDSNYIQITANIKDIKKVDPKKLRRACESALWRLHHWHNVEAYFAWKMDQKERKRGRK